MQGYIQCVRGSISLAEKKGEGKRVKGEIKGQESGLYKGVTITSSCHMIQYGMGIFMDGLFYKKIDLQVVAQEGARSKGIPLREC